MQSSLFSSMEDHGGEFLLSILFKEKVIDSNDKRSWSLDANESFTVKSGKPSFFGFSA